MDDASPGRWDRPGAAAAIGAAAFLLIASVRLAVHGLDPSAFILAGDRFCPNPRAVPAGIKVLPKADGYDGQFYYRLALDPFTSNETDFGIRIDLPAYRQQRIGYPFAAWLLAGGRHALVPWTLILANILSLTLLGWVGGRFARALGAHALWGLILPFYPGFYLCLSRDLAEIQACALAMLGLWWVRDRRPWPAALALTAAAFTRETTLLAGAAALLALGARAVRERRLPGREAWILLIPFALFTAWEFHLASRWGVWGFGPRRSLAFFPPFKGFLAIFANPLDWNPSRFALWKVEACAALSFGLVAAAAWRGSAAAAAEKWAWLLSVALASVLYRRIWEDDWTFLRTLAEFHAFGGLVVLGRGGVLRWFWLAGIALLWLILVLQRLAPA